MPKLVHDVGGRVLECGLDYLRVTAHDVEKSLPNVLHGVKAMQDAQEDAGHKRLRSGAEGFQGETCGGWRYGHRDGLTLLEASSERSNHLLQAIKGAGLDCRGTRVDLHVTYKRAVHDDEWAVEMRHLVREAEQQKAIKRQIKCEIIDDPKKGSTLYCYARQSRRYLRDYDKAAEQRHKVPLGTFRAEAEYKREMARAMFQRVRHCGDPRMLALDVLTAEWRRLGIDRRWNWKGQSIDMALESRPSDQIVTARWFINTAVPAFHRLTDPSLIAECLERLLTDPATGAYKEFAPPEPAPLRAPRAPRKEVAAAARKKVKESLDLPPRGAQMAAHEFNDTCNCDICLARRSADEA